MYKIWLWSRLKIKLYSWLKVKFFNGMINITSHQVEYVLKETKGQANNNLCFWLQAGQMTASNIKNICKTNSDMSLVSLLKEICYRIKVRSRATDWGCEHEHVAKCKNTIYAKVNGSVLEEKSFLRCWDWCSLLN